MAAKTLRFMTISPCESITFAAPLSDHAFSAGSARAGKSIAYKVTEPNPVERSAADRLRLSFLWLALNLGEREDRVTNVVSRDQKTEGGDSDDADLGRTDTDVARDMRA